MSSISSNVGRVSTLMASRFFMNNLNRTNLDLLTLQTKLATYKDVGKVSDDPIRAATISVLDDRLEQARQRLRNLDAADAALSVLDTAMGEASDLVLEAKSIALSQIGLTSDTETRRQQAVVIDSLIRQLYDLTNRSHNGVYIFGGSTATRQPVFEQSGGFRYTARGVGLFTDIGSADRIPVTLGVDAAIGPISSRLRSTTDLNPALTPGTRVSDLRGAAGLGVELAPISFSFAGGPTATVDLTEADTMQDVADALTAAIRQYETDHGVSILGPGGITIGGGPNNGALVFDMAGGAPGDGLVFQDIGAGVAARDLGLAGVSFDTANSTTADLDPRLTELTPVSAIPSVAGNLGSIRFRLTTASGSTLRDVDLSSAQTMGDIINLIQTYAPGVRAEIGADGRGLDVLNEIGGPTLTIEEVPGGLGTATALGIRTYSATTRIADFNHGRGVRIVDGAVDPVTGALDLRPQDLATVQSVIDRINQAAADAVAAGLIPAGAFTAGLTDDANGITFFDNLGLGPITVEKANNSPAAEDLGLLAGTWDAGSATFVAQDRAGIRVDNLFTSLIALRDALRADDSVGISLAVDMLNADVERIASTRALVGVHAQRVQRVAEHQEDRTVLDERIKSELQDLDFTAAAIRLSLLQTQLQAGLSVAARSQSMSLLDFLG
jgi:flagellin-like hook-associated protein FlgL